VRRRRGRKGATGPRMQSLIPQALNNPGGLDFVADQLDHGRNIRLLTAVVNISDAVSDQIIVPCSRLSDAD